MTAPTKVTTKISARRKLELSQVTPKAVQQECMGTDVNMTDFGLLFEGMVKVPHIAERITAANVVRQIDGSSTLTITVDDYDRALLSSDQLANRMDVQIDGLWFRLTGADKQGDELVLTFEDREIAVLRTYSSWKYASRSKVTRAEFVYSMIREVKEFDIPVVIPELHTIQPLQRFDGDNIGYDTVVQKTKGMPNNPSGVKVTHIPIPSFGGNAPGVTVKLPGDLTVKDSPANKEQLRNGQIIIAVGAQMKSEGFFKDAGQPARKMIVCCLMCAMVESTLYNQTGGDQTSVGLFQMQKWWGSYEERYDPETASRIWYKQLVKVANQYPNASYGEICWRSEQPAERYRGLYAKRRTEAEQWVTAFGIPGGDNETTASSVNGQKVNLPTGANFYFWRGNIVDRSGQKVRKPENTWTCIQRLAQEVDWKAFFVSGTFYFISEDDLLKQQPLLTLDEFQEGILDVSGDFHNNKKSGTLTITALAGRWSVPPGCVVVVDSMGMFNGRWLVSEYDRDLFTLNATIVLSRSQPALPEPAPAQGNIAEIKTWVKTPSTAATKAGAKTKTKEGTTTGPAPKFTVERQFLAKSLLDLLGHGWQDDNGQGAEQMRLTADGKKVNGSLGPVYIDYKCIAAIIWLIDQGFTIGTYAWCSDHGNDGINGHSGGHAVDISSVNNLAIGGTGDNPNMVFDVTYRAAKLLHDLTGQLAPRQLISGGCSGLRNAKLTALCITDPRGMNPETYYTSAVLAEHCNHIHLGY